MKYVYVANDDSLMVLDTSNGNQITIYSDDERFESAIELAKEGEFEDILNMSTAVSVFSFFDRADDPGVDVRIEDGEGFITVQGTDYPLHSTIVDRIVSMQVQGFNCSPLVNFLGNLYSNPSSTAVNELFGFIDASNLPITEDGHFIAYKIVGEDYKDIYSKTMDNSVGKVVSMPRNMVDDNRDNTCSHGLHFCSKYYLPHYGSSSRRSDRCLLVKINPADVVSIPSDYNTAKGRTWKYEVVGEVEQNWRQDLKDEDYTDRAVVGADGTSNYSEYDDGF